MPKKKGISDWLLFLIILVVLIGFWLIGWCLIDNYVKSENPSLLSDQAARGVFGDKFGVITSLFSSLAFVGIIFTILLQRRDLASQHESIEKQSHILAIQSFETGFFNLLNQHKSNVSQLKTASGNEGREVFSYFIEKVIQDGEIFPVFIILRKLDRNLIIPLKSANHITKDIEDRLQNSDLESLSEFIVNRRSSIDAFLDEDLETHHVYVERSYHGANERTNHILAHYFRTVYIIYKYIDTSLSLNESQKTDYARIVRALLSDDELLAIFYNSLIRPKAGSDNYEFGFFKMTYYVKKYEILQNLNKAKAIHPIHWKILDKLQLEAEGKMKALGNGVK